MNISSEIALYAAQLSMTHKLLMTDSLILAAAYLHQAELWTQDEHFMGLDHAVYMEKSGSA